MSFADQFIAIMAGVIGFASGRYFESFVDWLLTRSEFFR